MISSSRGRFLALAVGLGVSLTEPAVSVTHGHAHSEAIKHATHHDHDLEIADHPTISADDHDQDHGHPRLEPSAFTRVVKVFQAAVASEPTTIAIADIVVRMDTAAPVPNESPPDRPGAASPQSRAPPTL